MNLKFLIVYKLFSNILIFIHIDREDENFQLFLLDFLIFYFFSLLSILQ